jgi:hypothetical protein
MIKMPLIPRNRFYRGLTYVASSVAFMSLLFLLVSSLVSPSESDQLKYDVVRNNKVIGYLNSVKTERNNTIEYILETNVAFDILFELKIYSRISGIFSNGQLTDGKIIRTVNGKDKANARFLWVRDKYFIQENKKTREFKDKIFYTTACLMHREPINMTKIFSENFQRFIDVTETEPHHYTLHLPDGNKNFYIYENGICIRAQINTTFTTAYFNLKK